ncbi:hypothetical protein GJW-30_1_03232 [Variibacter gotjawalensis]|uniref:3-oxo-tetronate kinase n=1 Tax=Variibacter gotjawalensis TaxID=1333996 RepID=A0A0S3PXP5_9BRAD|nr:3-oxo-tetronate kinase [Variibacter gotjawalensis]NIK46516.1 uncharacterized protein YgbK (DUF1537 family) [Variibacter gotjawalensis]RZS48424.1 uncharacterized protein YgbK (DUF1537 family) [Variibacter gotjawalensis]BAT60683.1 hypothetical protein GJW-30_1_03232 [Variibacter gotjawalensis]
MLLGAIADDFTGASDLANTLAKGGMKTVQFVGVPREKGIACDAGVVALKTRSIAVKDAVAQSIEALDWLLAQGCEQILFKYCSTFDSTKEGNIGPVAEALLDKMKAPIAVVCPVFPATGRTLFDGHLFVLGKLLSESGMEKHPLTPMTDPNIQRWLRYQTKGEVGLVPYSTVRQGSAAIKTTLDKLAGEGTRLAVVDAVADEDLLAIGSAITGHKLVTGGSGIALGLPENFRKAGKLGAQGSAFSATSGPGVVLSGSCSNQSRAQVVAYTAKHPGIHVAPDELMSGAMSVDRAFTEAMQRLAHQPMIYTTADPAEVGDAQKRYGREKIAEAIEDFFGELAVRLAHAGARRIVVGGGETSGAVVTALEIDAFAIGPEIAPGVPALAETGERGLRLALKSGNFGGTDFYDDALGVLGKA